jgi:serine protease AprX
VDTSVSRRASSYTTQITLGLVLLLSAGLLPGAQLFNRTASVDPRLAGAAGSVSVIVQGREGATRAVESAVTQVGGSVQRRLPIVDGVEATIPGASVDRLAKSAGIRTISINSAVKVLEVPAVDTPVLQSVYPRAVGAPDLWAAGYTGAGVTVAVVDTGIAAASDLSGRVLPIYDDPGSRYTSCEDLSGSKGCADAYGHGTFVAGIIAGDGSSSGGAWKGIAPEANLVSIKIAGADGSSDVSNILAAIQWAVSFKARYGIRVLNLSLGTDATDSYLLDPLNYAVERAWAAGIVVVVAASNRGPGPGTISKPGDDPFVITVGAVDDRGTAETADDEVPNFSGRGPTAADGLGKPDVVAPGASIVSLRAPGSSIDNQFTNYIDGYYRAGSGTSMSAAVVSGTVALMLQADPTLTPDRVKYALMSTARPAASDDQMAVGAGVIDAYAAATSAPPGLANQGLVLSSGTNSLEAGRGHVHVIDNTRDLITGAETLQNPNWNGLEYRIDPWSGSSWYGSSWYGSSWYGSSWYGSSWYGSSWYGSSWYGQLNGSSWYGSSWYGSSWYGAWE